MTAMDRQRAQEYAMAWATQADAEYCEAIRLEDRARARDKEAPGYVLQTRERERRAAQFHGTRSVEAARMAEMWARVARALPPVSDC